MVNKNIITGALVFSLISFLLPLSNFLLLPIYTQYFRPEEFGVLAIMTSFTNLIVSVGGFRIAAAITPYYYEYKDSPGKFDHFYGNILQFTIVIGILTFLIGLITGTPLFKIMFKNDQSITFLPLGAFALAIGLFNTLKNSYLVRTRIEKKVFKYAIFFSTNSFLTIALQLLLIIQFKTGILGVLIARTISEAICALIILYDHYLYAKLKMKKEFIITALKFSIPMIPSGVAAWIYAFGDRFFIERYVDLKSLGIYSILITITGLVTMISDALINGLQPYLFDSYSNGIKENIKNINTILALYIHSILLFCSFLIMLGCNLNLFKVEYEYLNIYHYVSIAILVFLIEAYYKIFFNNIMFVKKAKTLLYLSIGSVIFVFILYFLLIPPFGIWGAIISNIISNTVILLIAYYISQKELYVPINYTQFLLIPFITAIIFFITQLIIHFQFIDHSLISVGQFILVFFLIIIVNRKSLILLLKR